MKRGFVFFIGMFFLVGVFLMSFSSAVSVCCEKTKSGVPGGWCQFTDESNCDPAHKISSTSCESTSYCKLGTCINSNEGTCMRTAEIICTNNGGFFDSRQKEDIPQCREGCCILGEEVAFITQTRCQKFSSIYGYTTNFRGDITNEFECLASASPSARGACAYGEAFSRKCEMTTKKECREMQANSAFTNVEFHEGYLCSAPVLNTICGKKGGTTCGKDGKVYFLDTCGNLANVYDASMLESDNYWTRIQSPSTQCTTTSAKGSSSCGNCEYHAGSTCKPVRSGEFVTYGNYICRNLDCKDYRNSQEGFSGAKYPEHGEAWCAASSGVETIIAVKDNEGNTIGTTGSSNSQQHNLPGSSYHVKECWEGEVEIKKSCQHGRQEVCIQSEINNIKNAVCLINRWRDCSNQNTSEDCQDREKRDCKWMATGYYFYSDESQTTVKKSGDNDPKGVCVPLYAPGFDRDNVRTSDNGGMCTIASSICTVTYQGKLGELKELKGVEKLSREEKYNFCILHENDKNNPSENCHCLTQEWENLMNSMCIALGDCGNKNNFLGIAGQKVNPINIEPSN